jgi:hypothetical protein
VEAKRIEDAFALLQNGPDSANAQVARRQKIYYEFLQKVLKAMGLPMVVLCAACLGPSAIASMKDRDRVELPSKMEDAKSQLGNVVLQQLAEYYSSKGSFLIHVLTGVYAEVRQLFHKFR